MGQPPNLLVRDAIGALLAAIIVERFNVSLIEKGLPTQEANLNLICAVAAQVKLVSHGR